MKTVAQLDKEIAELKQQLDQVKGTQTEIYTRIVGYYRSVKNWNRGKREEYNYRKLFQPPETYENGASSSQSAAEQEDVREAVVSSTPAAYLAFYRKTCANCPAVKNYLTDIDLSGETVDVDTEEGMDKARELGVMSTPTVIFYDTSGQELFREYDVEGIKAKLQYGHIAFPALV